MKMMKNEWCVPGPAGVARPTEAGRPVFSCVMRWPRRPAASKIRLPGWAAAPRLGRAAKVAKCKNEKNENNKKLIALRGAQRQIHIPAWMTQKGKKAQMKN